MITVMMNLVIILYKDKEEKRLFFFFFCVFSCYGNTDPFSLHDSFRLEMSTVQTDASDLMLCPLARESLVHSALWTPHLKPIQDPAACPELCALPATSGGEGEAAFFTHCRGSAQGWFPSPRTLRGSYPEFLVEGSTSPGSASAPL